MEARLLAVIIFLVLGQRDARIDNPFAVGRILLFGNVCFCYILYKNLSFFQICIVCYHGNKAPHADASMLRHPDVGRSTRPC
jgi:hypothetical protein